MKPLLRFLNNWLKECMKDQNIFSKVINLKIPITFSLHNVWILLGQEIWRGGGGGGSSVAVYGFGIFME